MVFCFFAILKFYLKLSLLKNKSNSGIKSGKQNAQSSSFLPCKNTSGLVHLFQVLANKRSHIKLSTIYHVEIVQKISYCRATLANMLARLSPLRCPLIYSCIARLLSESYTVPVLSRIATTDCIRPDYSRKRTVSYRFCPINHPASICLKG